MKAIFLLLLIYLPEPMPAQPVFPKAAIFYQLTMQHGLSSNRILKVLQDKEGFYWIATEDGVNRFDGTNVKVFRYNKNDSLSLSHNHCTDLWEDSKGNIWVATLDGLNCFIKEKEIFKRYYLQHDAFRNDRLNWIRGITEDAEGNIWITSFGLWKLNRKNDEFHFFYINNLFPEKSPTTTLSFLIYDSHLNGIWCNAAGGIVFFDIKKNAFYYRNYNPYNWEILRIDDNPDFCIDADHNMWIWWTPEKKLYKVALPGGKIEYAGLTAEKGISRVQISNDRKIFISRYGAHPIVYDAGTGKADSNFMKRCHGLSAVTELAKNFYFDKEGIYWIATPDGVCIFNPSEQSKEYTDFSMYKEVADKASEGFIGSSVQNEKKIWLYSHRYILCFDRAAGSFKIFDIPQLKDGISGVLAAGDSVLYVGIVQRYLSLPHFYREDREKNHRKFQGKNRHGVR